MVLFSLFFFLVSRAGKMKRTYALIGFLSGHDRLSICFPRSSRDFFLDPIIRHFRNVKITEAKMRSANYFWPWDR